MTDRDRLIEVIGKEIWAIECDDANAINIHAGRAPIKYADPWAPYSGGIRQARRAEAEGSRLIAAAERAGFRWLGPEDGR